MTVGRKIILARLYKCYCQKQYNFNTWKI